LKLNFSSEDWEVKGLPVKWANTFNDWKLLLLAGDVSQ
jgi:hypothetical protein